MRFSAEEIRASAIDYNRDFPDCVEDAKRGVPQVVVSCGSPQGSSSIHFVVSHGIYCNGFIESGHDRVVRKFHNRDRRVAFSGCVEKQAEKIGREFAAEGVEVRVKINGI